VGQEKSSRGNTQTSDQDGDIVTSNHSINLSLNVIEQMIRQPPLISKIFFFFYNCAVEMP